MACWTHHCNGHSTRIGQDEFDLVESVLPLPQLHGIGPAIAAVAKAVHEDDRGRVPAQGRNHHRKSPRSHRGFGIGEIGGVALDAGDGVTAATAEMSRSKICNQ